MAINISNEDYILIIKEVGYPVIKENELEYSREEIMSLFLRPSMLDYFIWFPIIQNQSVAVSMQNFEIDFPEDKFVYGVSGIRFSPGRHQNNRTGNIFVDALNYKQSNHRPYGTPYDYGCEEASYLERSYQITRMEQTRDVDYEVDDSNRKVKGFTNDLGELIVSWSKWSENFEDIPFKRRREVLELTSGRLMVAIANLESRIETGTGVTINTDSLKSDGEAKIENVMNKWKAMSKVVIQR